MLEFFIWPASARLFTTFFFGVCVLAQSASLVFSSYRHPKTRLNTYESVLELSVLLQILCLSLLQGQVYMGFDNGNAAPMGYGVLRIAAFFLVAAQAVLVSAKGRQAWPLLTIASALVALPSVEAALGKAYPWLFLLSLAFLLIRSVHLCLIRYREIKTGLSALSIKEAVDNLRTGILFCRKDGRILLESSRMKQLMTEITGEVQRNGALFHERLMNGHYDGRCERAKLDEQTVCLLPDETAWMFTKTDIRISGSLYVQLTASDVTERYRLTAELNAQRIALKKRSEELKQTIADLHDLSREQELARAKIRAHDILGQRLSVLLRMMRDNKSLDITLLKSLSKGLLHELSVHPDDPSPAEEFAKLRQIFCSIGVDVRFSGELPRDAMQASLLVDIIRESVANAVRHGFATLVEVRCFQESGHWQLSVRNNGHSPSNPIVEGGGIGGMRAKLAPNGGTLTVAVAPQFALSITLPGGQQ